MFTCGNDPESIFSDLECLEPSVPLFFGNDGANDIDFGALPDQPFDACFNCGRADWAIDPARGDHLCLACGMCDPFLAVHGPPTLEDGPEPRHRARAQVPRENDLEAVVLSGRASLKRKRQHSAYDRASYVNDRLAQWSLSEPGINEKDWEEIETSFIRFVIRRGFIPVIPTGEQLRKSRGKQIDHTWLLTKPECREVLEDCDTVREEDTDSVGNVLMRRGHFKKKYYERWMTIRWRFSGVNSKSNPTLVEIIKDDFPRLEEAFRATIGRNERKYFPNYNAMFHFLLELYNCEDLADAFPLPKTLRSRNKAEEFWWRFCGFLQWPCIRPVKFLRKRQRRDARGASSAARRRAKNRNPPLQRRDRNRSRR